MDSKKESRGGGETKKILRLQAPNYWSLGGRQIRTQQQNRAGGGSKRSRGTRRRVRKKKRSENQRFSALERIGCNCKGQEVSREGT